MIARLFAAVTFAVCLPLLPIGKASASTPQVVRVEPMLRDGRLEISADLDFTLNSQLRDAAMRGVALSFTADLSVTQPRWWWFDRAVVQTMRTWRVTYNALTRQWRISVDENAWPVASLEEAMQEVRQIRAWRVADASLFEPGVNYEGALRLRLDTSQLARPLQVNALNSSSWSVETPWANFSFMMAEIGAAP